MQTVLAPYDPEIEALLAGVDSDAIPLRLHPGRFVVFFPEDAHAPGGMSGTQSSTDQKIYCKGSDLNFRVVMPGCPQDGQPGLFLCLRKLQRKQIRILHFELQTDHFPSNRDRC
ncbi:MAG: hypothetical protein ACLUFI_11745 [Oscillospiraceae bacterium]